MARITVGPVQVSCPDELADEVRAGVVAFLTPALDAWHASRHDGVGCAVDAVGNVVEWPRRYVCDLVHAARHGDRDAQAEARALGAAGHGDELDAAAGVVANWAWHGTREPWRVRRRRHPDVVGASTGRDPSRYVAAMLRYGAAGEAEYNHAIAGTHG